MDGSWEQKRAEDGKANDRLQLDISRGSNTVEGFIQEILKQCREVYDRHDKKSVEEYLRDGVFRTLEIEMVEVKVLS